MTAAYAAFANGGTAVIPYSITEVKTAKGKVIYTRATRDLGRAMTAEQAGQMNQMLRETLVSGTARRADLPGWPAAGKTGTTQDYHDAWFIGYTGQMVTGVWVGNDDGDEMKKVTGSGLPAEIWQKFMRESHAGLPVVALPGLGWRAGAPAVAGLPASGPILPPGNVGDRPRPVAPRAVQPVAAEDTSPNAFNRQGSTPTGPTQGERGLLQRLIGG
jgi:penicillin-binding protein 1A